MFAISYIEFNCLNFFILEPHILGVLQMLLRVAEGMPEFTKEREMVSN